MYDVPGVVKGTHKGLDRGTKCRIQRMGHGWLALGHLDKQVYICEDSDGDGVDQSEDDNRTMSRHHTW
jgi:hypothetical protein